jgi:hypothetical protein
LHFPIGKSRARTVPALLNIYPNLNLMHLLSELLPYHACERALLLGGPWRGMHASCGARYARSRVKKTFAKWVNVTIGEEAEKITQGSPKPDDGSRGREF